MQSRFAELHKEKLETIDSQIALLHQQRKSTFYSALGLEYTARIVGCLEVWLILNVLTTDVSFVGCILNRSLLLPYWPSAFLSSHAIRG